MALVARSGVWLIVLSGIGLLPGCDSRQTKASSASPTPPAASEKKAEVSDSERFAPLIREIAQQYRGSYRLYGANYEKALVLCAPTAAQQMIQQQASELPLTESRSRDTHTHGQKLYHLWIKDYPAYLASSRDRGVLSPVGQTLVKETWTAAPEPTDGQIFSDLPTPLKADKRSYLFILTKLDPKTPGTDDGWVYGIVEPDDRTVIEAGRIASCIECHQQTTRDRLYGPTTSWPRSADGKPMLPVISRSR